MPYILTNSFIYAGLTLFGILFFASAFEVSEPAAFYANGQFDLRIIVMLLLAEPHFAMTIPLLFAYKRNFVENKLFYVVVPSLIVTSSAVLFFSYQNLFYLIFLFANVYHVNRQSLGFFKLQTKLSISVSQVYEFALFTAAGIAVFHTILGKGTNVYLFLVVLISAMLLMVASIFRSQKRLLSIREAFVALQGLIIFIPLLIFENIMTAFAVGISIHYLQYMAISWRVLKKGHGVSMFFIFPVIVVYAIFSTGALSGFFTDERISLIVFIPTLMQLLHFYYDGLMWRRSDPLVKQAIDKSFRG